MPIKSPRILIVESDHIIAESITLSLIQKGYYVESANTGIEAVEKAIASPPHVLLIEPHLQWEMQGANVANTIVSLSRTTEIIFLSDSQEEEVTRICNKKPCLFLSVPFDGAQILEAIEKCLAAASKSEKLFY